MDSFKWLAGWLEDARTWVGGGAGTGVLIGLYLKWRDSTRNDYKAIIEELREECARNEKFRVIGQRLTASVTRQQLEIVLLNKSRMGAIAEIKIALKKAQSVPPEDAEEYLERALRILEEEIIIPALEEDGEIKDNNQER